MNIEAKTESNLASDRVTSLLTSRWSWPCATIEWKSGWNKPGTCRENRNFSFYSHYRCAMVVSEARLNEHWSKNRIKPCLRSCHLLAHLQVVLAMCYYRMKIRVKESQAHAGRTGTFHSIVTIGVPWLFLKHDSMNIEAKTESNLASDRVTFSLTSRWSWPCATIEWKSGWKKARHMQGEQELFIL